MFVRSNLAAAGWRPGPAGPLRIFKTLFPQAAAGERREGRTKGERATRVGLVH